jgi:alkylation response protein AidB-like acyl-CoA dehydrogenase
MTDALQDARAATDAVGALVDQAVHNLAVQVAVDGKVNVDELDKHQVVAYDLAHAAAAVEAAKVMCTYGE